jgi:hypothetical protein
VLKTQSSRPHSRRRNARLRCPAASIRPAGTSFRVVTQRCQSRPLERAFALLYRGVNLSRTPSESKTSRCSKLGALPPARERAVGGRVAQRAASLNLRTRATL